MTHQADNDALPDNFATPAGLPTDRSDDLAATEQERPGERGSIDASQHNIYFGRWQPRRRERFHQEAWRRNEPDDVEGKRCPRTLATYQNLVRLLYQRAGWDRTRDIEQIHVASPLEVAEDLIASCFGENPRTPSSWRVNRAALLQHLAVNRHRGPRFILPYQLLAAQPVRLTTPTKRKSRRRQGIPKSDLNILLNTLLQFNGKRGDTGSYVQFWLLAGIAAGGRVDEWQRVCWADREACLLTIPNKKLKVHEPASKAVKAAGKAGKDVPTVHDLDSADVPTDDYSAERPRYRTIRVHRSGAIWIDLHLGAMHASMAKGKQSGKSEDECFENYYNRCRNALWLACKKAFDGKRSYTLRMARSQFAANDRCDSPVEEVAKRMGHLVIATTRSDYPSGRYGWSAVEASEERAKEKRRQRHTGKPKADRDEPSRSNSDRPRER